MPHTTAVVFVCVIPVSLLRVGATAPPCCRRRVRGRRPTRHPGCPRCHRSPGSMKPPTRAPSTNSARLQAPRAQRTQPCATIGANRIRAPRCSGRAYFASSRRLASHLHRGEQKRCVSATAVNSRQQRSHRRCPNVRMTPCRRPLGRPALQVPQIVWFPWPAKKSFEQRLQVFLTMDPERLIAAWIQSGGNEIRAGWQTAPFLKNPAYRTILAPSWSCSED